MHYRLILLKFMTFLRNSSLLLIIISFLFKIDAAQAINVLEGEASEVQVQTVIPDHLMTLLEKEKYIYTLDSYKNIVITIDEPTAGNISSLQTIITEMGITYRNYGLYVHIPVSAGEFSAKLEKLGLRLYELNSDAKTLTYLYANGRNIPDINYAYSVVAVCLLRTNPNGAKEALVINEPQKTISNLVGGCLKKGESPEDAVVRCAREEISVDLNKAKLKLVAVCHTIRADKKSYVEFLYTCDEFHGKPTADGIEFRQYTWAPLSELLKSGVKIFAKPFSPIWQKLLKGEFKDLEKGAAINRNKQAYQRFSFIEG